MIVNIQHIFLLNGKPPGYLNRKISLYFGLIAFLLLFGFREISGQSINLRIMKNSVDNEKLFAAAGKWESFIDTISMLSYLQQSRQKSVNEGFLTASFDSLVWASDSLTAFMRIGYEYQWAELRNGNVPEEFLNRVGFRDKIYRKAPFKPALLAQLFEKLLDYSENSGYPFAEIHLDSLEFFENSLKASLHLERHNFIKIDSVIIKGNIRTSRNYLENYIGISKNMAYNQQVLNRIPDRLRELPFVQVIKPYEIGLRPGKADVYLYLDSRKASNFNGVLGVLPDNETGKVVFTGDVELNLMNALSQGETINMRWQRLQTRTQQLDLRFAYPYILNTPFGTEFKMNLYRQDTLFSQINIQAAIQYYFSGANFVKVFVEQAQANVISAQIFSLDRYVDSRSTLFGIGATTGNLDYRFNPRRGYFLETTLSAGNKKIEQNAEVNPEFYEGLTLNSEIYNLNFRIGNYFPIGNRATILTRVFAGHFINENMFRNEMYRLGGLKSIRGFDEQSIFASTFAIGTIEFRYLLEQNSNLFIFVDQGYYEDQSASENISDTPFGFGGGINFETAAGIFSLTYALGRQFDNNISLRGGKLHFGFVSFF